MLQATGSTSVTAGGTARIEIGPGPAHQTWRVHKLAVRITEATDPTGELFVYLDEVAPSTIVAGTHDGAGDVSDEDFRLSPGQRLIFDWFDIDPTSGTATAVVSYDLE